MIKQAFKFIVAATLLVASGSFARADTYSVVSDWTSGSAYFGDLVTYTGDGTFDWDGTTFSNISFDLTETSYETCTGNCPPNAGTVTDTNNVIWTATDNDGALYSSNTLLVLGDNVNGSDCSGPDCVGIFLSGALATSGPLALSGTSGFEFAQNVSFVDATVTDTSYTGGALPEPSAVALLGMVSSILGFVIFRRRKLVR